MSCITDMSPADTWITPAWFCVRSVTGCSYVQLPWQECRQPTCSVSRRAGKLDADDRGKPLQALLQPGQLRVARAAHLVPDVVGEIHRQHVLRDRLGIRASQMR